LASFNTDFRVKEEQLIADGCKRLIENSIICWNYLYLSKLINNAESHHQKADLIKTIKNSSVVVWRHINLQGEYNFSEEVLKNFIEFSLPEILELQML
jgi:hypothetical protein